MCSPICFRIKESSEPVDCRLSTVDSSLYGDSV